MILSIEYFYPAANVESLLIVSEMRKDKNTLVERAISKKKWAINIKPILFEFD